MKDRNRAYRITIFGVLMMAAIIAAAVMAYDDLVTPAEPTIEYIEVEKVVEVVKEVEVERVVEVEKVTPNRYGVIELTEADKLLLCQMCYHEARGESFAGQRMVIEVALNRVLDERFDNSVRGVIFAYNQFSTAPLLDTTTPTKTQQDALEAVLTETPITDADVLFFGGSPYNSNIFAKVGNHYFCSSKGVSK